MTKKKGALATERLAHYREAIRELVKESPGYAKAVQRLVAPTKEDREGDPRPHFALVDLAIKFGAQWAPFRKEFNRSQLSETEARTIVQVLVAVEDALIDGDASILLQVTKAIGDTARQEDRMRAVLSNVKVALEQWETGGATPLGQRQIAKGLLLTVRRHNARLGTLTEAQVLSVLKTKRSNHSPERTAAELCRLVNAFSISSSAAGTNRFRGAVAPKKNS